MMNFSQVSEMGLCVQGGFTANILSPTGLLKQRDNCATVSVIVQSL